MIIGKKLIIRAGKIALDILYVIKNGVYLKYIIYFFTLSIRPARTVTVDAAKLSCDQGGS